MRQEIKSHFERNKTVYYMGALVGVAGITWYITRRVSSPHIGSAIGVPAQGAVGVLGQNGVSVRSLSFFSNKPNLITVIENGRQGPPSWVVRCLETDGVFTSQKSAAKEMGVQAAHLSEHLNGVRDHVDDLHFERICLAA